MCSLFVKELWLNVFHFQTSCRLEDCLEDYTRLEILKDCICRKCSVLATHKRLLAELKTLEEALAPVTSPASSTVGLSTSPSSSNPFSPSSPVASSSAMPSSPQKTKPSQSKKKRYKEVKKMEQRVKTALVEGRIEDETLLEGVRLEKVVSPASTKQAMIARVSSPSFTNFLPTDNSASASSSTRSSPQPIRTLRPIRVKEHNTRVLP